MARPWCTLLLVIACIIYGYEARSNICLKEGTKTYKPLQLYPSDCPANLTNCMAHVYQYDAPAFKSKSVSTLLPKNRESFVYIAQDEEDRLDVVVITKTDYKNNTIQTSLKVTGSAPADILLKDDPGDQWSWDVQNTQGDFTWYLEPTFTDGVVAGHFKIIDDDFCVAVTYLPNWAGAIRNFIALSGTVAKPVRSITKALSLTPGASSTFEFCTYPRLRVTTTSGGCGSSSATAVSLDLPASATYVWKKDGVTVGTTASISGLSAGTYTVTTTVTGGCQATREIVIGSGANSISFSATSNPAGFNQPGRIDITVSGGTPPYSIVFRNSAGTVVATNVTTYSGPAGTYTIRIRDGCNDETHTVEIGAPDACPPGTTGSGGNCENCPAGTFSSSYDSATCTVCPPGQRNNAAGSTSCPSCPANTITAGGNDPCIDCPKNTYSATGSATCTPCPLGTTRENGQSECSACGSGSYRCSSSGSCSACPAGSFSSAELTAACEKCPAGSYQSATGRSLCVTCPAGQYAPSGSASCQNCPSGKTSPAGSSVLLACV